MTPRTDHRPWRVQLELAFESPKPLDLGILIPTLHRLIQERALDETWIDVVDYRHVGDGPGLLLVSHDAYYGVEHHGHRSTLLYRRRRPTLGVLDEELAVAAGRLLAFAEALAREELFSAVCWRTDRWTVTLHDRLLSPSDPLLVESTQRFQELLMGSGITETRSHRSAKEEPWQVEPWVVELIGSDSPELTRQRQRLTEALQRGQTSLSWAASSTSESSLAEAVP